MLTPIKQSIAQKKITLIPYKLLADIEVKSKNGQHNMFPVIHTDSLFCCLDNVDFLATSLFLDCFMSYLVYLPPWYDTSV